MSCRTCGCDPEANDYKCQLHREFYTDVVAKQHPTGQNWKVTTTGKIFSHDLVEDGRKPLELIAPTRATTLPTDGAARKQYPIATGFFDYFPDAIAAIAHVSWVGNEQHNPGEPLHWARGKSMDQEDTALRHFAERGKFDKDGVRHTAKFAWRALAILQLEIEGESK